MATSLLDGIDFDDPNSWEIATVVKVLCIATQERFNIGAVRTNGTFLTSGSPSNSDKSKYFPYKSNTGLSYELAAGDPIPDFTEEVEDLLSGCAGLYADIEKWNDADTNSDTGTTIFRLSGAADAPGTYDNRLLEVTGYTTYPDLSVYAPEEIKKWYDMLVEFKYVVRSTAFTQLFNSGYKIFNGVFDVGTAPFYSTDQIAEGDNAKYFGIDETSSTLEDPATTTPYSDMKTANSNLFGTTTETFNEDTEGTKYTDSLYPYVIRLRRDSGGDYISYLKAFVETQVIDWEDMRDTVGFVGKPVSYKTQESVTISENFPTGEDTNMTYPYSTTADNERFYCDVTVTEASTEITEIEIDLDLGTATMPTNLTDISSSEDVTVLVTHQRIGNLLEDWDAEGGFDYYTPAP
jgi:hypothetical protein